MDVMLVQYLLVKHPFVAGFGWPYKAWREWADPSAITKILTESLSLESRVLV